MRPYGDLDVIYTHLSAVKESGSPLYALDLASASDVNVSLSLMTEVGGGVDLGDGTTLWLYAAFGGSYLPDNERTVDGRFVCAAMDNGTFTEVLESPELLGKLDLGLQLYSGNGFEVKAGYSADIGDSFLSHSASARLAIRRRPQHRRPLPRCPAARLRCRRPTRTGASPAKAHPRSCASSSSSRRSRTGSACWRSSCATAPKAASPAIS